MFSLNPRSGVPNFYPCQMPKKHSLQLPHGYHWAQSYSNSGKLVILWVTWIKKDFDERDFRQPETPIIVVGSQFFVQDHQPLDVQLSLFLSQSTFVCKRVWVESGFVESKALSFYPFLVGNPQLNNLNLKSIHPMSGRSVSQIFPFFLTFWCGNLAFGCALPSAPPASRRLPLTHNSLTHNSLTHKSHTHTTLTHTQLSHTQVSHTQLSHTQLSHTLDKSGSFKRSVGNWVP